METAIQPLLDALWAQHRLSAIVAAEIECYVTLAETTAEALDRFWVPVDRAFRDASLPILRIEKERGDHQYEIITTPTDPLRLIETLRSIRTIIEQEAATQSITASFGAKPFHNQPGSGLHIHLHLADENGASVYHKSDEIMSDALRFSLSGLLATLPNHLSAFLPMPEDYDRLDASDHVPKILGWGVNNRYCALRIPMSPGTFDKRIEHRMASANADPETVVAAILAGVLSGLSERTEPPPQTYGKTGTPIPIPLTEAV